MAAPAPERNGARTAAQPFGKRNLFLQNYTPPGGVEPPTFRLTAERANHCATEATWVLSSPSGVRWCKRWSCHSPRGMLSFATITKRLASAGNRTRAARVAGEHSTTEPPMRMDGGAWQSAADRTSGVNGLRTEGGTQAAPVECHDQGCPGSAMQNVGGRRLAASRPQKHGRSCQDSNLESSDP